MGLFNMHYDRPGPGVSENEPRKKGFARVVELLGRDFGSYFKAGFLALLGSLPFICLIIFANITHALIFVPLAGIFGGMLAMPEICGVADTILRSLRDEPGYWWDTYRRAWKRNAKATLLPGALCGLIIATQIFTLWHASSLNVGASFWVLLVLSIVLSFALLTYVIAQLALVDVSLYGILKNSALMFLGFLPRSMGAVAVNFVYWGVVLLFFPVSALPLVLTNFWLPMLLALMIVYPPLEKSFNIEATIKTMRDDSLAAASDDTADKEDK